MQATVTPPAATLGPPMATGLSDEEAARRAASGLANVSSVRSSRTVGEILRANLLTRFNALLGSLLLVILVVGPPQDAFFGLILVLNSAIGIFEELRAKRTLDRLALVQVPKVAVMRDGREIEVAADHVVLGDVLRLREGQEVPVDGEVVFTTGLEVSEALLTGEARPVTKRASDSLLGGSFVTAGSAICVATQVGDACYASKIAAQARRFQLVRSDLMVGINRILRAITWLIVPMAFVIVTSQLLARVSVPDAIRASVAALVTLVPEGLVLLTSLTLAVAVVRLGRRNLLVQELAAVEMLARADVLCIDKTGTLTDGTLRLDRLEPLGDEAGDRALAAMIAADPHGELAQIAPALPSPPAWRLISRVPFSSERRWASATFDGEGTWMLGAPEALLPADNPWAVRAAELSASGSRVLLLGRSEAAGNALSTPVSLVVLRERLRTEAGDILRQLGREGVRVEVLSGDHRATVAAVVRELGLEAGAGVTIRGRVSPEEKERVIRHLQAEGRTVAMIGDGVNDILALKAADIAVAIGTGSTAARAVSGFVLLDGQFGALAWAIREGRRVIANVERLASLFLAKTTYAALLGLGTAVWLLPFPFLPRHLTLIAAFTIGIPAFFLALAPSAERARPGFLQRVGLFALPAGTIAAVCTFSGYYLALSERGVTLDEARTSATVVLAGLGIWILAILARPPTTARRALIGAMIIGLVGAGLFPPSAYIFGIDMPDPILWLAAFGLVALGGVGLELTVYQLPRLLQQLEQRLGLPGR
jgi:cation-transporting P-type ATPase E